MGKMSFTVLCSIINWTLHNGVQKVWQAEQSIFVEYSPSAQSDVTALCFSGSSLWLYPSPTAIGSLTGVVSHSKCVSMTLAAQYWGNSKSRSCPCNLRQNWDKGKLMCREECPKFGTSCRRHGQIRRPLWAMGFMGKGRRTRKGCLVAVTQTGECSSFHLPTPKLIPAAEPTEICLSPHIRL